MACYGNQSSLSAGLGCRSVMCTRQIPEIVKILDGHFNIMIRFIAAIVLFLIFALIALNGCNRQSANVTETSSSKPKQGTVLMAERININQLDAQLVRLAKGQTEFPFLGITSNGVDCLYFVADGDAFNIEFEAMSLDQKPYIEKLTRWADSNGFRSKITTYNNKPQYTSDNPAPVIRIETNSPLSETAMLGKRIETELFGNTEATVYDVVP
jgi:hypothetical protein